MNKPKSDFLLIDDDEVFLNILARALKRRGYLCETAQSQEQALNLAEALVFSRAIVDLKLGQESGLQLIKQLYATQETMEILMLTGYSSISTAVDAIKLGAVNYLCKPADVDEILAAFASDPEPAVSLTELTPLSVDRLEWEHIQKILQQHDGNISATARSLGMHRRTLQRKLQKRPVRH